MCATEILIAILSILGGGGLGAAIVGWLANRKKNNADVVSVLMQAAEQRIQTSHLRCAELEARVDALESTVALLRSELSERETMVEKLQRENTHLKREVEKLKAENKCKDRKIDDLTSRIRELEEVINRMREGG